MKIPEQELNNYMVKKISEDNKLRILFGMEPKEEKIENEEKENNQNKKEIIVIIILQ